MRVNGIEMIFVIQCLENSQLQMKYRNRQNQTEQLNSYNAEWDGPTVSVRYGQMGERRLRDWRTRCGYSNADFATSDVNNRHL